MKPMLQLLETANLKSHKEMNEYSCYLCQIPIKTAKQLVNHVKGRPHREVFESRKRNEKRYDYNRDNPGRYRQVDQEPEVTLRRSTRRVQHTRERYVLHQNNYIESGDNRVNSHIGPGPDCSSEDYEQEPPDNPTEDNPHDTYVSFQLPVRSPSLREPNLMTHSMKVEDGDAPSVIDVTPDPRMLTPTPTTEDLVRRFGDGWTELKEG
jgi:hypothetical protein